MFKITLIKRRRVINLNLRVKFLTEILLNRANKMENSVMLEISIKLSIANEMIVRSIKNIIFDIGFNSCIKDVPGTKAKVNFLKSIASLFCFTRAHLLLSSFSISLINKIGPKLECSLKKFRLSVYDLNVPSLFNSMIRWVYLSNR